MADSGKIEIRPEMIWEDIDQPTLAVDQYFLYQSNDQTVLILGEIIYPLVTGDASAKSDKIAELESVKVKVRGRFALANRILDRLAGALRSASDKNEEDEEDDNA